jgi:fatty acid desaturase
LKNILDSRVRFCLQPKNTRSYDRGTVEWEMTVHRYAHVGRFSLDLEEDMQIQITTRIPFVVAMLAIYAAAFYLFPAIALVVTFIALVLFTVIWLVVGHWFRNSPRELAEKELALWVAHSRFQSNHPSVINEITKKRVELYAKHGVIIS